MTSPYGATYIAGRNAGAAGEPASANPHLHEGWMQDEWRNGHAAGVKIHQGHAARRHASKRLQAFEDGWEKPSERELVDDELERGLHVARIPTDSCIIADYYSGEVGSLYGWGWWLRYNSASNNPDYRLFLERRGGAGTRYGSVGELGEQTAHTAYYRLTPALATRLLQAYGRPVPQEISALMPTQAA